MTTEEPTAAGRVGAAIVKAIAERRADGEFMDRLADRLEQDADILDRLAYDPTPTPGLLWWGSDCDSCGNTTPASMRCSGCGSDKRTRKLWIELPPGTPIVG